MNIAIMAAIVLTLGFLRLYFRSKRIKRLQNKAFEKAYGNQNFHEPELQITASYGYPAFTLRFRTKNDFEYAEINGLNKVFKEEIQFIHGDEGEFDSDHAVFITYDQ